MKLFRFLKLKRKVLSVGQESKVGSSCWKHLVVTKSSCRIENFPYGDYLTVTLPGISVSLSRNGNFVGSKQEKQGPKVVTTMYSPLYSPLFHSFFGVC